MNPITEFNHLSEDLLMEIVVLLKIAIEAIALLILALAVLKALRGLGVRKLKLSELLFMHIWFNILRTKYQRFRIKRSQFDLFLLG